MSDIKNKIKKHSSKEARVAAEMFSNIKSIGKATINGLTGGAYEAFSKIKVKEPIGMHELANSKLNALKLKEKADEWKNAAPKKSPANMKNEMPAAEMQMEDRMAKGSPMAMKGSPMAMKGSWMSKHCKK
jgi:hypothetical protein